MRVGDCIDDEWCVVWLLRELSSKWDVVARYAYISFSCFSVLTAPAVYLTRTESSFSLKLQRSCLHG